MQLAAIREKKAGIVAEMRSLTAGDNMTDEAKQRFDALKTQVSALEADEARAVFIEEAERRAVGQVVDKSRADAESRVNVLDAIACQIEQRAATGALAEFQQEAKRMGIEPSKGGILVPSSIFEKRATQTTATSAAIVPDDFKADQVLENALKNTK